MMNLETTPTIDLLYALNDAEKEMKMLLDYHEKVRKELVTRFPIIERQECFKELVIARKDNENEINKTKIL